MNEKTSLSNDTPRIPEFAHYYGDWIWNEELTGWIKSLLLFFDGIALALPIPAADRLIESSPVLAQPLAELGLLRNYGPDRWLDPYVATVKSFIARYREKINTMEQYLDSASDSDLDHMLQDFETAANQATAGLPIAENVTKAVIEARIQFGIDAADAASAIISTKQESGQSSNVRTLRVRMVSNLLRQSIADVSIEPVINDESAASFIASMIGSHDAGRAKIVTGDLAHIGIDLSAVPLDEVLDFRSQHGSEYRRYSNDVRMFVLDLSLMNEADRHSALINRRAELVDRAEQLRKTGRTAFARQAISFGFGFAGAAWTLVHGDPWGAAFATAAASAGLTRQDPEPIGASYTYILRAKTELAR